MMIPNDTPRAAKDTTQRSADAVRYRVLAATFVNGRMEYPERADGTPNHVRAAPGLEGPALKLAPEGAASAPPVDPAKEAAPAQDADAIAVAALERAAAEVAAAKAETAAARAEADAAKAEAAAAVQLLAELQAKLDAAPPPPPTPAEPAVAKTATETARAKDWAADAAAQAAPRGKK